MILGNLVKVKKVAKVEIPKRAEKAGSLTRAVKVGSLDRVEKVGSLVRVEKVGSLVRVEKVGSLDRVENLVILRHPGNLNKEKLRNVVKYPRIKKVSTCYHFFFEDCFYNFPVGD